MRPAWLGPRPRVPKAQGPAPVFERRGLAPGSRSSSRGVSVEESVSVRATSLSAARPPGPVRHPSRPSRRLPEPVSTLWKLCSTKYYWGVLCASLVVQSSTGTYFVQAL